MESFNTRQVLLFYRKYNHSIEPDHVVLTLHMNDFQNTPVAFVDGDGYLRVSTPNAPMQGWRRVAYRYSELYRHYQSWAISQEEDFEKVAAEVRSALDELRQSVGSETRFSVVFFPVIKRESEWTEREKRSRVAALEFCRDLQLRCFDLTPLLFRKLEEGADLWVSPGDVWHPNEEFAQAIAEWLQGHDLL